MATCVAVGFELFFGLLNLAGNSLSCLTAVTGGFASHQIVGLNGGGAFVNGQNFRVAVILGGTGFFDKAHAAMHLHAKTRDFQTHLSAKAFDQGHQKFVESQILFAGRCIGVVVRSVIRCSGHGGHGSTTFGVSTHCHEHAAHIGVVDDGRAGFHAAVDGAALHAVTRKLGCLLVRALCHSNALHAYGVAGGIHHDEHVFQTAILFTYQVADGTAVIAVLQNSSRAGFDTHLVFDADAVHVVACANRSVFVHQKLWHHEQANAFDTFRRTLHTGQHEMDDVMRHIMFTVGDVNLGAKHFVSAIGLRLGARANRCQIRTRLGLGQVHRAGPLTRDELL